MSKKYMIDFDFLGKDSVPFKKSFEISEEAYYLLEDIISGKKSYDKIFSVTSNDVNKFIQQVLPEGSAKLFRTAMGTKTATDVLKKIDIDPNATVDQKLAAFNKASLEISKMLNHKKGISKNFNTQLEKADESLKNAKAKRTKAQKQAKADMEKIQKSMEAAKKALDPERRKIQLAKLAEKQVKIKAKLAKADAAVEKAKTKKDFKNATKDVALGTARNSYFSPRVIVSWAKHNNVPIGKIYSQAQQTKFAWAMDTPEDYYLNYPNVPVQDEPVD